MDDTHITDAEQLIDEVVRYLAAVDAFRAANCEPTWRPEYGHFTSAGEPERLLRTIENSAH